MGPGGECEFHLRRPALLQRARAERECLQRWSETTLSRLRVLEFLPQTTGACH